MAIGKANLHSRLWMTWVHKLLQLGRTWG